MRKRAFYCASTGVKPSSSQLRAGKECLQIEYTKPRQTIKQVSLA